MTTQIKSGVIAANAITGTQIAANAINATHLAAGIVVASDIADNSITSAKIAKNAVDSAELVSGSIDTVHIADSQVTNAKLANSSVTVNSNSLSLGGTLTLDTDDIGEGSTNQYFTNARAQGAITVTDAGGDGSLGYSSGTITYTGPSAAETRAHFSAGTGVTLSSGQISIGQDVGTTATPTFGNITTTGYLAGPATFTIDPAAVGDNTGTVVIAGNFQVDGTTTTVNSTTVTVDDKLLTLASGSINAAAANGGGIEIDITGSTNPSILYDGTNDEWDFNKDINVAGINDINTIDSSGSLTLTVDDADFIVADSTDTPANFIWRDHDVSKLYLGTSSAVATLRSTLDLNSNNIINIGTISAAAITTTAADQDIDMDGSASGQIRIDGNGYNGAIALGSTGMALYNNSASRSLILGTNETARLTIAGGGDISFYEDTGTTAKLFWDASAESLGIGTTNPAAKLNVFGSNYTLTSSGKAINGIHVSGDTNGGADSYGGAISFGTGTGASAITSVQGGTDNDLQGLAFIVHNSGTGAADGVEAMRIDSSGNVGIGTSSPTFTSGGGLEIYNAGQANLRLSSTTNNTDFAQSGADTYIINRVTSGDIKFRVNGSTELITIDGGTGSVGISNSQPSSTYKLDVSGAVRSSTAAPSFNLQETDASNQHWALGSYAGVFALRDVTGSTYPLQIEQAVPTNTLYLDSTGNVGIGTNDPASILHVDAAGGGVIRVTRLGTSASAYGRLEHDGTNTSLTSSADLIFNSNAAYAGRFDSSGNLLVGKTSSAINTDGVELLNSGRLFLTTTSLAHVIRRKTTDGSLIEFQKDTADVGSIGTYSGDILIGTGNVGVRFIDVGQDRIIPRTNTNGAANGTIDLGDTNSRFRDLYLSGTANAYNFAATNNITIDNSSGYGAMELGGTSGAYIDLKSPSSDDYDLRLITFNTGGQIIAAAGSPLLLASSGNSNQLYLDSSGNVGIGTGSPTTPLSIRKAHSASYGSGVDMLDFKAYFPGYDTETSKATIFAGTSDKHTLNTHGGYLAFKVNQSGYSGTAGATNLVEAMRIEKNRNVGIGTTSPGERLEVKAGISYVGHSGSAIKLTNAGFRSGELTSFTEGAYFTHYFENYTGGNGRFYDRVLEIVCKGSPDGTYGESVIKFMGNPITNGSSVSEIMRINGSGKVGIGTNSPNYKLEVSDAVKFDGQIRASSGTYSLPAYTFHADNTLGMYRNPNVLGFAVAGSNFMSLNNSYLAQIYEVGVQAVSARTASLVSLTTTFTDVLDLTVLGASTKGRGMYLVTACRESGSVGTHGHWIFGVSTSTAIYLYTTISESGLIAQASGSKIQVRTTSGTTNIHCSVIPIGIHGGV